MQDDVELREEIVRSFLQNLVLFVGKVRDIHKDTEISHMEGMMQIGHELSDLGEASEGMIEMVMVEENQVTLN